MSGDNRDNIRPPGFDRREHLRQKSIRIMVHIFGWLGIAVLYYVVFSLFFDTPIEYNMKRSTAQLSVQYEALNARYDTVEQVLRNVIERDKAVFHTLFEADPYDFEEEFESSKWDIYDKLLQKSTKELRGNLTEKTRSLEKQLKTLADSYGNLQHKMEEKGDEINHIPSIQPVVNKDLTLLTASFGMRIHPFYKTLTAHQGVDYTVSEGSRVFATADGTVKDISERRTTSGITVTLSHGNGYETQYSHLGKVAVKKGDRVKRGDIIALSGNTGLSLAPHLHYEVRHNGMRVDPIHYFFMELFPSDYRKLQSVARSGMQSFD